jgi:hypothetical protein
MYLRTLQVLQNLVGAGQLVRAKPDARPEQASAPVTPAPEPASSKKTQPLTPPYGFVPPFPPAHGERPSPAGHTGPPVSHENHESSLPLRPSEGWLQCDNYSAIR